MSKNKRERNAAAIQSIGLTEAEPSAESSTREKNSVLGYLRNRLWIVGVIAVLSLGALGAGLKYLEEDARGRSLTVREGSDRKLLDSINPFLSSPPPPPSPTPQLSKSYIYAGQRLLSVVDENAQEAPPADLAVWRPSTGVWWVLGGPGSQQTTVQFGLSGDIPVPGDYDGDGKTDFCVFRPSDSTWYIVNSSTGSPAYVPFGVSTDKPVAADFDGDGRTDVAVFRGSSGNAIWYILRSSDSGITTTQFGLDSDIPTPVDFDGDGKSDMAFYRSSEAKFYYLLSSQGSTAFQTIAFGVAGDKPVPGDYDGDGKADAAVWRGGVFEWHILYSSTGTTEGFTFGDPNSDIYVQNDYDGDGKVDRAFWRPSNGTWHIVQSSRRNQPDELRTVQWGQSGDIPVPAFYRR